MVAEGVGKLNNQEQDNLNERVTILDYLSFSEYMRGNLWNALTFSEQLLELSPNHPKAEENVLWYRQKLAQIKKGDDGNVPFDETMTMSSSSWSSGSWFTTETDERYEALCRGEKLLSDKIESQLVCFHLNTTEIPFMRLMHIKVEEAFKEPQIVVFHEILWDSEIELIKQMAKPRLFRAEVEDFGTGHFITADYRVAQVAWLKDWEHPVIDRISQRISDVTGLDLSTAESLQVGNYGIGGQYDPHYDFTREEEGEPFPTLGIY